MLRSQYIIKHLADSNAGFDKIIINANLVNLLTKEIYRSQVAIKKGIIYAVDENLMKLKQKNTDIVDANNSYIVPGFIDQHIHLHHTHLNIVEFSKIALKRGTTAIATDFYGEGVVRGIEAIRTILDIANKLPLRLFYLLPIPGYFQNGPYGHNGNLKIEDMYEMLSWDECVGLSDTFAIEIVNDNKELIELCKKAQLLGKKVSGHASELSNFQINNWVRKIRDTDDHECINEKEMLYKLRLGIGVSMRLATGSEDLFVLVNVLKKYKDIDKRRITLNSDVISATDLYRKGYLDRAVKFLITSGVPVLEAYQMATINTAENLKINSFYGSISPGRIADILFIDNLEDVSISAVMYNGEIIIENGTFTKKYPEISFPKSFFNTVKIPPSFTKDKLKIFYNGSRRAKVRIIEVNGNSYITNEIKGELSVRNGVLECDIQRDILYVSAIERVLGTGKIANAFVKGFSLKKGAIAMATNSHMQNLLSIGTNHDDIYIAIEALKKIGGGLIAVCDGRTIKCLPLELFGLESLKDLETVVKESKELLFALKKMGCRLPSPFQTLSFIGLPVIIGKLKLCQEGLVDVWENKIVNVIQE